jgi:hypothetical protein
MPSCQEAGIHGNAPLKKFSKVSASSLQAALCALIFFGVIGFGSATAASAQDAPKPQLPTQASPSPAARPPDGQAPSASVPPKPVAIYNLLQKKSIVFPDIAYSTERLSTGQKFELFVDGSVSVDAVTWAALGSAVGQAVNSPTGFGQEWGAYGKRFGADLARESSSEFFGTFLLASTLHEDPRFYAEVNPKFFHAVKYSAQHIFIMRNDDGHEVFAWSRLVGPAMAEGLANVYWPDRNRTVGDTLFRYGLDLASRMGGNMLREYWPVVLAKISHTRRPGYEHN